MATSERTVDLIFLLSEAARSLETELTAAWSTSGRRRARYCVLSKALEGELHADRARRALRGLDKTTMVVTIDELEKAGLAERRPSPTDRRARIIAVTDAGAEVVARGRRRVVDGLYADVLDSLPDDERSSFVGGLVAARRGAARRTRRQCVKPVRRRRGRA